MKPKGSVLPHWESFKKNLLPMLRVPGMPPAAECYEKSFDSYKCPGFYEWQNTEMSKFCTAFYELIKRHPVYHKSAEQQFRVLSEETYAVMTFEQQGCRIVRPSPALVMLLLNTVTDFPIADVRPPWPHVYVELPQDVDLKLTDYYDPGIVRSLNGYYVTWAESGEETRRVEKETREHRQMLAASGQVLEMSDEDIDAAFGDWSARFLLETVDNRSKTIHERTVQYFNLHWKADTKETVDEAFTRFKERMWTRTSKGLEAVPDGFNLRERIMAFTANLFMYMALPTGQRDVVWVPDPERERLREKNPNRSSKQRRNLKARVREEMRTEGWEVGQTIVIQRRPASEPSGEESVEGDGTKRPMRSHWVRGHYRSYWYGQRHAADRHKEQRWIMPYLVMGIGPEPQSTVMIVKE